MQRRDGSTGAYIGVVEAEGFKMGAADENVLRRDALAAARRLRDRFLKFEALRCEDALVAMETTATAQSVQASGALDGSGLWQRSSAASAGASQISFNEPVFPPANGDAARGREPGTARLRPVGAALLIS